MGDDDVIYCLVDRADHVRSLNVYDLMAHFENGYRTYLTAEDAEEGRQRGDAYDEPWRTKVVGFRAKAFLPEKKRRRKKANRKGNVGNG